MAKVKTGSYGMQMHIKNQFKLFPYKPLTKSGTKLQVSIQQYVKNKFPVDLALNLETIFKVLPSAD